MIFSLTGLATVANSIVFAASSSDDDSGSFGLILLAAGPVFYALIYFKYRNVNKRHKHESETDASLHNMQQQDDFVESRKGLSQPEIAGRNNKEVRGSLRKFF